MVNGRRDSDERRFQELQKHEEQAEAVFRDLVGKKFRKLETIEADLESTEQLLRCELESRGSYYAALDWLLFLRNVSSKRLLACLNDGWETAHHAEYFSALSQKSESDSQQVCGGLKPKTDDCRDRRLAEFVAGCFVWRQLKVFRSLLAFEVEFAFEQAGHFPTPKPRPDQQANIDLFNARNVEVPMLLVTGAGIAVSNAQSDTEETTFVYVGREGWENFAVGFFGISKLYQLYSMGVVKPDQVQTIGDLLITLKVGYIAARNAGHANSLTHSGLVCMEAPLCSEIFAQAQNVIGVLEERFAKNWSFGDPGALIQRLRAAGSDRQFGPPIRQVGNWLAIDLFSASSLLDHLLFHSFTKLCDDRGPLFEDDVQKLIDRTPWKPNNNARQLRGRKVKDGERVLTDLDALGFKDGVLLVVECKAKFYGLTYGPSSRQEIRNVREEVEKTVRKCDSSKLRSATSPNLAQFPKVIRTVCTPTPVYVEKDYAVPKDGGFPDSISYWELYRLLIK